MQVKVNWQKGMVFAGTSKHGKTVIMDAHEKFGGQGQGPTPVENLLMALGGCTGMDTIAILRKVKHSIKSFCVLLEAKRQAKHPKVFRQVQLTYHFQGDDSLKPDIIDAVAASQTKYCAISAMLAKSVPILYRVILNDSVIATVPMQEHGE